MRVLLPDLLIVYGATAARHNYFFSVQSRRQELNLLLIHGAGKQLYLFLFYYFNLALKLLYIAHHYFAFLSPLLVLPRIASIE